MLTCCLQSWCQQFQSNLKIQSAIWTPATHFLAGMSELGGAGGALLILVDQLTLSQPGGQIMPTTLLLAPLPRIFRPSYGPVSFRA